LDSRLTLPPNTVLDVSYRIERVIGSGGFGITYAAEDLNLGTQVAIKEYYPFDFGDRDATMNVRPKSERHEKTFRWGRSNFLQEARNLAHFEHPSIVRVTRVFEANSTAYMVMRFERGQNFEEWLRDLGRPPSQQELDGIVTPLLEALEMMHEANFLHRDIAPDNIIVRSDGTPVLLDFGAARRAVAEMSRAVTGIVKPGYSPHEQYTSDNRLQGPWSDLYAFGGTLYRALTGRPPEEATLRVDEDRMPPAVQAAKGQYRQDFLEAVDACLRVKGADRPRSVAQLRSKLLGRSAPSEAPIKHVSAISDTSSRSRPVTRRVSSSTRQAAAGRWLPLAATLVAIAGGSFGGYEYFRWQSGQQGGATLEVARKASEAAQREAKLDEDRLLREEQARAAAEADARRSAAEAEERRRADAERQAAQKQQAEDAERRRNEEYERITAEEQARRTAAASANARRQEEQAQAIAALTEDERLALIKRVQQVLQTKSCYIGSINGRTEDAQKALQRFADSAERNGGTKLTRIELAKATTADFEGWFRDAEAVKGGTCVVARPTPPPPQKVTQSRQRDEPRSPARASAPRYSPSSSGGRGGGGTMQGIQ
jgi:serine/threonine protein kinase